MKPITVTGVQAADANKLNLGYAVCRQWRDNPRDVEVFEYADTAQEARAMIRRLPRSIRYIWFVGVYQ